MKNREIGVMNTWDSESRKLVGGGSVEQEKLRQIAYKVLQETLTLGRNVLFFLKDITSVKYIQEIIDAIHNIQILSKMEMKKF